MSEEYNFVVNEQPLRISNTSGQDVVDPTRKVLVRDDDMGVLGVVGRNYQVISHTDVIDGVDAVLDEKGWNFEKIVYTFDGGSLMRASYKFPDMKFNVTPDTQLGDYVGFGIDIVNGIGGRAAVRLEIQLLRLVCLNGMKVSDKFYNIYGRHTASFELIGFRDNVVLAHEHAAQRVIPFYNDLSKTEITEERSDILINGIVQTGHNYVPKSYEDAVRSQLKDSDTLTLWALYNAFTYAITRQSFEEGKVQRSRKLLQIVDRYFRARHAAL